MSRPPAPLNWAALLPLDVSLAHAAIGVCLALCMAQVPVILGKVRMTGALIGLAGERAAVVERYALGGELVGPTPASPTADHAGGRGFVFRHSGTSVIVSGSLRRGDPPFQLAFHPAVAAHDVAWSVVWLCGLRRPPPGLHTAAPPLATQLSIDQLPFTCRELPT